VDFPWPEPGEITLREATEWFKQFVRGSEPLGMLTNLEHKYANERWAVLIKAIADVQGIPSGMLSYFLGELAQTEMQLAATANAEAEAALMYGQV
jgi:hypothetical protein